MEQRVAIVTGGLRGLGRAMAFGLAREGHSVLAVGHIDSDVVEVATAAARRVYRREGQPSVVDEDLRVAEALLRHRDDAVALGRPPQIGDE